MPYRKRGQSTGYPKSLIWAYAMLAIVSIGVVLYLQQIVLNRQVHAFSSFLIKMASQKVLNICSDFAEIELQRENFEAAKTIGDRDLIDAYRKQIEGRQARLRDQISDYQQIMLKLGNFREKIVKIEFTSHVKTLIREKAFSKVQATRLAASHYEMLAKDTDAVTVDTMRQACRENLVKF
jgi:hypothetical protein